MAFVVGLTCYVFIQAIAEPACFQYAGGSGNSYVAGVLNCFSGRLNLL
jgi:hypothetical protein